MICAGALSAEVGIEGPPFFVSPHPVDDVSHTSLCTIDIIHKVDCTLCSVTQIDEITNYIPNYFAPGVLVFHPPSLSGREQPCGLSPPPPRQDTHSTSQKDFLGSASGWVDSSLQGRVP